MWKRTLSLEIIACNSLAFGHLSSMYLHLFTVFLWREKWISTRIEGGLRLPPKRGLKRKHLDHARVDTKSNQTPVPGHQCNHFIYNGSCQRLSSAAHGDCNALQLTVFSANHAWVLVSVPPWKTSPEEEPILFHAGPVEPSPHPPPEVEGLDLN